MPKRRMTAARILQIATWQKAGAKSRGSIPRSRYMGKSGLPRVEYGVLTKDVKIPFMDSGISHGKNMRYAISTQKIEGTTLNGMMVGRVSKNSFKITKLHKYQVGFLRNRFRFPTLRPGSTLLSAAAKMSGGRTLKSIQATNPAFYALTGATADKAGTYVYTPAASQALKGQRIVRVSKHTLSLKQ